MYKKSSDDEYSQGMEASNDDALDKPVHHYADHSRLVDIGSCIDAIQEKIDIAYGNLCMVLPQINMEIYRTFKKALDTLDSLSSKNSSGKIDSTLTYIKRLLETVCTNILHVVRHDSRIYAELETLKIDLGSLEPDRVSLHTQSSSPDQEILLRARKTMAYKDDLIRNIAAMKELADTIILDIDSYIHKDISSLEHTLNSMIFILKDLIERSNSTKDPIVEIMSGLQTHDIVNQDINNISTGLLKIKSLNIRQESSNVIPETMFFQKKASLLSHILINKLILVIRNHGSSLENEINRIEEIVSHVKEDKDTIADFLLVNEQRASTFDMVILEISEILDSLFVKINRFSSMMSAGKDILSNLVISGKELEESMAELMGSDTQLPVHVTRSIHRGLSVITSISLMNNRSETDFIDIDRLIEEFTQSMYLITYNLKDIRALLIESIEGIDIYSRRCMDSISRFRQDITILLETLNGSDYILDELEAFSSSIGSSPIKIPDDNAIQGKEGISHELHDLLHRLENPHSNSLMRDKSDDPDEGMTLF
ncbi:MAG: hypothetical protein JXM72_03725 [Deltaproteobacteria bacterium]|nr:hypothetical protein [Deltaproteobacteria bacterium]